MNSLPWIGKILGCLGAERAIEGLGYKKTMYLAAAVQIIAVISKSMGPLPLSKLCKLNIFLTEYR